MAPDGGGQERARNVLGGPLRACSRDPVTGWHRDGSCRTAPADVGSHTICAVMTAEFLDHQRGIGNDLMRPMPAYSFPGLTPGDRWCVTAANWLRAHRDGTAAPVVLAATSDAALAVVPLDVLRRHAVDVPDDASALLPSDDVEEAPAEDPPADGPADDPPHDPPSTTGGS